MASNLSVQLKLDVGDDAAGLCVRVYPGHDAPRCPARSILLLCTARRQFVKNVILAAPMTSAHLQSFSAGPGARPRAARPAVVVCNARHPTHAGRH